MPPTVKQRAALMSNGLNAGSPGWTIVEQANIGAHDPPTVQLRKLMDSFWRYGRTRWR